MITALSAISLVSQGIVAAGVRPSPEATAPQPPEDLTPGTIHDEGRRDPEEPRKIYEGRVRTAWKSVSAEIRRTRRPEEIASAAPIAHHGIRLESSLFSGDNGSFLRVTAEYSVANGKFVRAEVIFRDRSGLGSRFYIWGGPQNTNDESRIIQFFLPLWDREHPPLKRPEPPGFRRSLWRGIGAVLTRGRIDFAWTVFMREQAVFVERMSEETTAALNAPVPALTSLSPARPAPTGSSPITPPAASTSGTGPTGGASASRIQYRSSALSTPLASLVDGGELLYPGELVFEGLGDFRRDPSIGLTNSADHVGGAGKNELPRLPAFDNNLPRLPIFVP